LPRAPQRPNPLDISAPRLLRRAGCTLWVSGIDAWPGTPILDIKGYAPRDDLRQDATVPDWLERLWSAHDAERGLTSETESSANDDSRKNQAGVPAASMAGAFVGEGSQEARRHP
jgi:tRNA (Thr-GGU) A37 N-methylase